jgi:hypothetical protein
MEGKMKKIIVILFMFLASCSVPEFVVNEKTSFDSQGYCVVSVSPLNKKAILKYSYIKTILIDCWDYNVGDTLKLTRKEFVNFKR